MSTATERDLEYAEGRKQYWHGEAERLARLVRTLGGNPEPGAKQSDANWLDRPIPEDVKIGGVTYAAGVCFGTIVNVARAYRAEANAAAGLKDERDHFCSEMRCSAKPGAMLQIARELQKRNGELLAARDVGRRAAEECGAEAMRRVLAEMVDGLEIIEQSGWDQHNRAIVEAGQMIRNAPRPHDYHGAARESVQATLSSVELPVPPAFADIAKATQDLHEAEVAEVKAKAGYKAAVTHLMKASCEYEIRDRSDATDRAYGDVQKAGIVRRIQAVILQDALRAIVKTEPAEAQA